MKYWVFSLSLTVLVGCGDYAQTDFSSGAYYNLDSLIDAQSAMLIQKQASVQKSAFIDGEEEISTFDLDSAEWMKELSFFRKLDINKPRLQGVYNSISLANGWKYVPKEGNEVIVQELSFLFDNEKPVTIEGVVSESNEIYSTSKNIKVRFQDGILSEYWVEGFQKIILKDTTVFNVEGKVVL